MQPALTVTLICPHLVKSILTEIIVVSVTYVTKIGPTNYECRSLLLNKNQKGIIYKLNSQRIGRSQGELNQL